MHIDPKSKIAGIPALTIKTLLQELSNKPWTIADMTEILWTSNKRARKLLNQLHALGYIQPNSAYDDSWEVTVTGRDFALASTAKPINRSTADRLIKEIIGRAHIVNTDDKYLFRITKIHVFGSYLSQKPKIGDINLVISLEQKEPNNAKLAELMVENSKRLLWQGEVLTCLFQGFSGPLMKYTSF
jgi:predicted nucleotidyltransferase